jgi:shikimate kinase
MKKKNDIILIGMPGAGKSTIGVLLAKALGKSFIDTDLILQKKTGCLLQEIIDNEGVNAFLNYEQQVLLQLNKDDAVIATGGSAVYSGIAMTKLKENGIFVYLYLSFEEMEHRLQNIASRGIALGPGKSLKDLYEERTPLYKNYADVTIDGTGKGIEQVIEAILAIYKL